MDLQFAGSASVLSQTDVDNKVHITTVQLRGGTAIAQTTTRNLLDIGSEENISDVIQSFRIVGNVVFTLDNVLEGQDTNGLEFERLEVEGIRSLFTLRTRQFQEPLPNIDFERRSTRSNQIS